MSIITDDILKKTFPELFMEDEFKEEEEKKILCKLREAIRTRLDMDQMEVTSRTKEKKFTANEAFLYGTILFSDTKTAIATGLMQIQVDVMEEEIQQLKARLPSSNTKDPVKAKAKPSPKKSIKK